jgi:predicted AlkP superfamily pyrophosphatase or phosphodiesterase
MIAFYFSDLDDAGHAHGPDSPEVRDAVADVDRELGRLLEGVDALPHGEDVYVVVVADHGMLRAEAARAMPVDMALLPGVSMVESGPYASFFVDEGGAERGGAVRDSLRAMLPEAEVWLRADVPGRFHYAADPRIGDVVALAAPGATIATPDRIPVRDGFTHGWDNQIPEMGAVFVARGPRIEAGVRIPPFESVHVYPLLAHLLGLEPNARADGRLEVLGPMLLEGDAR